MVNLAKIYDNIINGLDKKDSPIPAIYENTDVPNVEPLEVNILNPNFIVSSDSSEPRGGFVESGKFPLSTSK